MFVEQNRVFRFIVSDEAVIHSLTKYHHHKGIRYYSASLNVRFVRKTVYFIVDELAVLRVKQFNPMEENCKLISVSVDHNNIFHCQSSLCIQRLVFLVHRPTSVFTSKCE